MAETIRVLVADDHLIVRQGLRLILETDEALELVGEASDGAEAVQLARELAPDVVLMDLRMPGMDGLTAIERLQVDQPQVNVVILTTFNEDELMIRGLRAGAKGYLLKDTSRESLFAAIRAAAKGEALLSPEVLERLLTRMESGGTPGKQNGRHRPDRPRAGSAGGCSARRAQQGDRLPPGHQRANGQSAPLQHL